MTVSPQALCVTGPWVTAVTGTVRAGHGVGDVLAQRHGVPLRGGSVQVCVRGSTPMACALCVRCKIPTGPDATHPCLPARTDP